VPRKAVVVWQVCSHPNGDQHALLLIPCDENQGDSECEDEGEGTADAGGETSQRPNVVLPGERCVRLSTSTEKEYRVSPNAVVCYCTTYYTNRPNIARITPFTALSPKLSR